jgi:sialic acid synthase SpsE
MSQGEVLAPVQFIAEVSSNHHKNLDRCLALIAAAAEIGCSAVKFQLFKVHELFAPEILTRRPDLLARQAWELPVEFLPDLAAACKKADVAFACTPFYLNAVEELRPYVDFYKVASYELLWSDLLVACAMTEKPVKLATGMATMPEIRNAVQTLRDAGCRDLTLLHCVSGYPAPVAECNLAAIETLRKEFHCPVGWSDHSANPGVVYAATLRWDAAAVEFHLDLDGTGDEFKTGHCWLPGAIAQVIRTVEDGRIAAGTGQKVPVPAELFDRDWRADPVDGFRPLAKTREGLR